MSRFRWDLLIAAVIGVGLGIASGWYAAASGATHEHDEHPAEGVDEHDHVHFSEATLAGLGVEYGTLLLTATSRTRSVVGTIVETPATHQPVQAPIGGIVQDVAVQLGEMVEADSPVATLTREPIPLPQLTLTAEYVAPAHDEVHGSIRDLRAAHANARIAQQELERVTEFTDTGETAVLPIQRRIDLEYELERARMREELARHELERHGFSAAQLEAVTSGRHVQLFDAAHVRRALEHAGMWNDDATSLLDALPDEVAARPFAVGAVAELVAHGLVGDELLAWLTEAPDAGDDFLQFTSLLLAGTSLEDLRRLHRLGALASSVSVPAPGRAPDWDVAAIPVRPGDRVVAGAPLVLLRDPRAIRLRVDPVGSEIIAVQHAVKARLPCRAEPLVPGTGPSLSGLRVEYVAASDASDRVHGWAQLDNEVLATVPADGDVAFRTWALHPGLRYRLLVPVEQVEDAFVLPRSAITNDGPDRVLFVPTGDGGFEPVPLAVLFEDEERVVLGADANPALRPGTRVVTRGAFELGLAMHADEDGGHGHSH